MAVGRRPSLDTPDRPGIRPSVLRRTPPMDESQHQEENLGLEFASVLARRVIVQGAENEILIFINHILSRDIVL